MTDQKNKRQLWYTRRGDVERGPYPRGQISRYILLGRITDNDQLRSEQGNWAPLSSYPELVPEVMKLPPTEENLQKLMMARMREDERSPRDRRDTGEAVDAAVLERRSGGDRRLPESEEERRYRALKYDVNHAAAAQLTLYRYPLVLAAVVLIAFLLTLVLGHDGALTDTPDCGAEARPGVNWNHCDMSGLRAGGARLDGAQMLSVRLDAASLRYAQLRGSDLGYSSLMLSDLRGADLRDTRLVGASLRGSDLRRARLRDADLSYANLGGAQIDEADFTGAVLDNAIWTDYRPCAPGSVGRCKRQAGPGEG